MSTNRQGEEDRSGFSRQDEALARWKREHPDYEVRVIKEKISGKKNVKFGLLGQFLKDAQKGKVAPGTVLVVETFSRLSRDDMQGCMQLMLDIFNAGLGVSFCDWGCQILRSLDETGGTVFQIVGAAQRSHGEWLEKFKQQIEAHIERRDAERAANPQSSEWPQPEKAWPHIDSYALKTMIVQRQTEARAHQSKRPKTLSQQQAQQQQ